jgi:hypothetical protein
VDLLGQTEELALHTRRGNQIKNEINREGPRYGDALVIRDLQKKYPNSRSRTKEPSRKYNCHGLCFAARRTTIIETPEVKRILLEDDYIEIGLSGVLPGDIAVYYTIDGDIDHSGMVIEINELKVPVIVSKWGTLNEVIHQIPQCSYDASNVKYYRIIT